MDFSRLARFAVAGSDLPSCFTIAGFDGMAMETKFMRDRDVSDSVIPTHLRTRESTFRKV